MHKVRVGGNELAEDFSPMFKRKCHGTAKLDAWVHVMTLGLINVAHISMHYAKKWQKRLWPICAVFVS
jgi:hypothetical protein